MLSPELRTLRARLAAHAMHAQNDPRETSEAARANSPSSLAWHERQVDPDGLLDEAERLRRAESARKAYFARLSFRSAQVRAARKAGAL